MHTYAPGRLARQYWWIVLIWGLLVVLFGLCALIWPHLTLFTLIYLFGIFALYNGILGVIAAFQERRVFPFWGVPLGAGVVSILFGLAVIFWPHITALIVLYLIAVWAIVTGVFQLSAAVSGMGTQPPWFLAVAGIISILLGIILFASSPLVALLSLVWVIGIYALVYGGILIARAFHFRSLPEIQYREPEIL